MGGLALETDSNVIGIKRARATQPGFISRQCGVAKNGTTGTLDSSSRPSPRFIFHVNHAPPPKRFVKDALNTTALKAYVGYCSEETRDYFSSRWIATREKQVGKVNDAIAQLIVYTASRCLFGKEIREQMDSRGTLSEVKRSERRTKRSESARAAQDQKGSGRTNI